MEDEKLPVNTLWHGEKLDALRALAAFGLCAKQIAAEINRGLGTSFTKNAIIGASRRHGVKLLRRTRNDVGVGVGVVGMSKPKKRKKPVAAGTKPFDASKTARMPALAHTPGRVARRDRNTLEPSRQRPLPQCCWAGCDEQVVKRGKPYCTGHTEQYRAQGTIIKAS